MKLWRMTKHGIRLTSPAKSDSVVPSGRPRRLRVICPSDSVTGGPEALHQLVHIAAGLGVDAKMVYSPPKPFVTTAYAHYGVEVETELTDAGDTVVVMSEMYPRIAVALRGAVPVFWWLSWDYGAAAYSRVNRRNIVHVCQSHYAFEMLRERQHDLSEVFMLGDYTRDIFCDDGRIPPKEDLVAYFPAKGHEFAQRVIDACPELEFVAIQNMSPAEVRASLLRAKVYIDFGHHPGKDRMPREAVVSGCCVITSSDRGASRYFEDIPIPDRYKFSTRHFAPDDVARQVRACVEEYSARCGDFELYRAVVRREKSEFVEQVSTLLGAIG